MFSFLKNHPFAVKAHFDSSTVLTFAVPKEQLQNFIPECLELDVFNDKYAFIAVAMVQTKNLRPKGFPKFMGNNFFLIGYRIFVRYTNVDSKQLRGLYILKSETDKKKMEYLGNIFTNYKYSTTDISQEFKNGIRTLKSQKSNFNLKIDSIEENVKLPINSPFANWKEARKFAGPLPFTFNYNQTKKEVLVIQGLRENWIPKQVKVIDCQFDFLKSLNLENVTLANAFVIENIPYEWKKGKTEVWKP